MRKREPQSVFASDLPHGWVVICQEIPTFKMYKPSLGVRLGRFLRKYKILREKYRPVSGPSKYKMKSIRWILFSRVVDVFNVTSGQVDHWLVMPFTDLPRILFPRFHRRWTSIKYNKLMASFACGCKHFRWSRKATLTSASCNEHGLMARFYAEYKGVYIKA